MSTLDECIAANILARVGGNLRRHQQPHRLLVIGVTVLEDLKRRLPGMETDNYFPGSVRPVEQAAVLFNHFVAGEDFDPPVPHEMEPKGQGVWRLRTPDLRFDGWFPERNYFVIGAFDSKSNAKIRMRSDAMVMEVLALRSAANLADGKYMSSEDYYDLIRL
jgi:hypothetical protein